MLSIKNFITIADSQVIGKGVNGAATKYRQDNKSDYNHLKVEMSFGAGRATSVPWIAFLGYNQKVKKGIYPVFLYYKELKLLVLAYGVSETEEPSVHWNLQQPKSITTYFLENELGIPPHYGSSLIFKIYDAKLPLDDKKVAEDLDKLIELYNQKFTNKTVKKIPSKMSMNFAYSAFNEQANNANLFLNKKITLRFIASLLTKPFVILTGLSGSGKTKLAQAFASWICENDYQYCIVPVGADWTNREPLLGFPNALKEKDYVKPDNKVLDLIIAANNNEDKPYFLILDEMNLSHVERYFADFLSVMETKSKISLHPGNADWNGIPAEIGFPKNLFIIGTVNIDETTYMFSPKVLDRANVIEFRVTIEEMETYLKNSAGLKLEDIKGSGAGMATSFVDIARDNNLASKNDKDLKNALIRFFTELKKTGAEFGYRSASEIFRFSAVINTIEPGWSIDEIIDAAIMQKLLPKVHGSRRKLEPVLKTLGTLCLKQGQLFEDHLKAPQSTAVSYPVSLEKIVRMYENLLSNGFTSYAEA